MSEARKARQAIPRTKWRTPYAVRYPWAGWGADTYAHRSLFDGAGEPRYATEPEPNRASMRRRFLTEKTCKWRKITWPHTHVWNAPKPGTEEGGQYWPIVLDDYWRGAINPAPICAHDNEIYSPLPMSDIATWWYPISPNDRANQIWNEPVAGVRFPDIVFFYSATTPEIAAEMDWGGNPEMSDSIVRLKRKCSRVLCYKDVIWESGSLSFNPLTPFAVLRRAAKESNWNTVDIRFEPFGWAEALDFSCGYELDETLSICPEPPPHESDVLATQSADFDVVDLGHLSAARITDGLKYIAPHADADFSPDDIAEGRKLDLIIEADFIHYKWWQYDSGAAGSGMDKMVLQDSGFAGIYGKCHVIF